MIRISISISMCSIIYSVALGIILENSNLKLTSTTHEVNKKSLLLYSTNLAKYSKFTHQKGHIYICKYVLVSSFGMKIMHKSYFLQQDI